MECSNNDLINLFKETIKSQGVLTINKVNDSFTPTIETNPHLIKTCECRDYLSIGSGTQTILSSKNCYRYIVSVNFSMSKNATCDVSSGSIGIMGYVSKQVMLCGLAVLTLTAERDSISVTFAHPVRLDRNTAVTMTGSFTAGSLIRTASITYYEEESI